MDNFHARVQAIRERNARRDESAKEILSLLITLTILAVLAFKTF